MFILICSMLRETLSMDHTIIFSGLSLECLFPWLSFLTLLGNLVICRCEAN